MTFAGGNGGLKLRFEFKKIADQGLSPDRSTAAADKLPILKDILENKTFSTLCQTKKI